MNRIYAAWYKMQIIDQNFKFFTGVSQLEFYYQETKSGKAEQGTYNIIMYITYLYHIAMATTFKKQVIVQQCDINTL